jgi:hypothetical protein
MIGANCHEEGWTVRWRKPKEVLSVAVARRGTEGASESKEAAAEGGPWRLAARLRVESVGSKEQVGGKPKVAAARMIGKSRLRVRLCIELERSEIIELRSQSMGKPKMILMVTSEASAKEIVIGEPEEST